MKWLKVTFLAIILTAALVLPAGAVPPTVEIISNGTFPASIFGWSVSGEGGLISHASSIGHDAPGAMCLDPDATDNLGGVEYNCFDVRTSSGWPSGASYIEVEGYFHTFGTTDPMTVTYGVSFFSAIGCLPANLISRISNYPPAHATSDQWYYFEILPAFPPGAVFVKIDYTVETPVNGAYACFDDLKAFSANANSVSLTGIAANSNVLLLVGMGMSGLAVTGLKILKRRDK